MFKETTSIINAQAQTDQADWLLNDLITNLDPARQLDWDEDDVNFARTIAGLDDEKPGDRLWALGFFA